MGAPALVLDFGGPVLLTPFELAEQVPGTPAHALLHRRGPLAPLEKPDPAWQDLQEGIITERAYWAGQAVAWHAAGGAAPHTRALIASLYHPARPELIRDEARRLITDAQAAGHPVAILTNDLRAFHSDDWVEQIAIVGEVDVVVDASVEGYLKPDPRLYALAAERLGVGFAEMVFVDDQQTNIRGAEALGIPSVWFDAADPASAFAQTRKLLGFPPEDADG